MWGGYRLKDHLWNTSQNKRIHVNHTIITMRRTAWYPQDGNAARHIPNSHRARILTYGMSSTIRSSLDQFICSRSPKVYPTSCSPSRPVAPNGEYGRHPEASTPGVTKNILHGSAPSVYTLRQLHTGRAHPAPVWWLWDNLNHVNWRNLTEYEAIMVSPRPNGRSIWKNWRRVGICGSWK